MSEQCLIVGAGPIGLTLANLFSKYGISYRIIDQNPEPVIQTKAAALWAKSMEALHHLDLDEKFLEIAHRSYSAHMFQGGQERVHLDLSKIPSHYNFITLIPQHLTEATFTKSLLERHGVHVERGLKLLKLEGQQAILEAADGTSSIHEFRYIFGCDGAHSRVRKEIGATFEGDQVPGFWLVGDIKVESDRLAPDEVSMFLSGAGPIAFFALGGSRYRIVALSKDRPDPVPLEFFEEAAKARVPFPVTMSDPQCLTGFTIHERQADKYSNGTSFLLGDAAHIHSPAGGQGLNTGLQDAFNLAWKVAQVLKWGSPPALLETYHQERHPVARRVMEASGFAIRAVSVTNPIVRGVQSAAMSLAGSLEPIQARIRSALSELDIHYGATPLNAAKGSKTLKPGDRMPEVYWRDAKSVSHRLYELYTGFHWTLISHGPSPLVEGIDPSQLRQVEISRLGESNEKRLSDPTGAVAEACGLEEGGHLLVRPDGYLAGYFSVDEHDAIRAYWNQHCGAATAVAPG